MVIKQEPYVNSKGKIFSNLVRHYSDSGKILIQNETGIEYEEAIDVVPLVFTYSESEKMIETGEI